VNRREAIAISSAALASSLLGIGSARSNMAERDPGLPWYRRSLRWEQTINTERDSIRYDITWWREYWKRNAVQGVAINAGGIVAFYPSQIPFHRRAEFLNGRDLYGELVQAAREEGLVVVARMDSGRTADEAFLRAHPDWFTRKQSGEPYQMGYHYLTCINGPYYDEYFPSILQEIIERTHPEGFMSNWWTGLTRDSICYCENCTRKFREKFGQDLPKRKDWNDTTYRKWIQWNYDRRTELWDLNNRVTRTAGGPHCIWTGDIRIKGLSNSFQDLREIGKRSEFLLMDRTSRDDNISGFQESGDIGKLTHQLVGWDKAIAELMPPCQIVEISAETMSTVQALMSQYPGAADFATLKPAFPSLGSTFWLTAKPEPEARMWMVEGIAGGMNPWCFFIGGSHEDRRMYRAPERVLQWHKQHEQYLANRRPVAGVGVVWSQRNRDYYGRDDVAELVDAPYRGFTQALIRGRIPYLPLHASDVEQQSGDLAVLILPNVGVLSDAECDAIRQFARRGGAVIASGATSFYDEWGDARADFALADLFGAHAPSGDFGRKGLQQNGSYLRLTPELRGRVWGPKFPGDPVTGERHPVLHGFDDTDIIPFGGELESLRIDAGTIVPLTFVPPVPISSVCEDWWISQPKTDIAGLVINLVGNTRVAYLPADVDRRYARNNLPDQGNLLANIVRWAAGERIGFELQGPGLIDCHVYRQPGRMIVHLVNLTNQGTWQTPLEELIPVGPLKLRMKLPDDVRGRTIECLVSGVKPTMKVRQNWASLEIQRILDHEMLIIS
jgi:Hypothetical glycosyl hydrolase 6